MGFLARSPRLERPESEGPAAEPEDQTALRRAMAVRRRRARSGRDSTVNPVRRQEETTGALPPPGALTPPGGSGGRGGMFSGGLFSLS